MLTNSGGFDHFYLALGLVKNLPKYVNEDGLREFFSEKGEVTEDKPMSMCSRDGKHRRFAFIGFKTESNAQEALNYFNNSYMDTCKITCEEELEEQKAEYAEKIKNKLAQLHKVAEEKKAMVKARRGEEILIAAKHRATGFVPKKAICCFGPQNLTLQLLLCAAYLSRP